MRDAILSLLYPTACRVCGATIESWRDGIACVKCWNGIEQYQLLTDYCGKCGVPLPSLPIERQLSERRCGRCDDLAFNFARSCGPYVGALRESVLLLKTYPQIPQRLRQLLSATFTAHCEFQHSQTIIPMPLHPARFAERTFNQAEIIAVALSAISGLRVDTASVIRTKQTPKHRIGMGTRERTRSLEHAFCIRAPRLIRNRIVLVVDDVMTTSSTAHELAKTLLGEGARAVNVLTVGRAIETMFAQFPNSENSLLRRQAAE
jgi:ComF family protein